MNHHIRIRPARDDEGPTVAAIIADAFQHLEVSKWMAPDPEQRRQILPAHFGLFTTHAITHGTVHLSDDLNATAVWLPSSGVPEIPDFDNRNKDICGDRTDYFDALGACFDTNHPHHPDHHYLQFMAVRPGAQGQGLGTALLTAHLPTADTQQMPSYLEAASVESRRLYLHNGYQDHAAPIYPGTDSPPMYPMWRDPVT